jgi:hypothetical protein
MFPGVGLDASWAHALSMAHASDQVFGRDVAFTFGPLGYLYYPVPGLVEPFPAFACGWIVQFLFLCGVLLTGRALGVSLRALVVWFVLTGTMVLTSLPFERMQLSFLSLAIAAVSFRGERGGQVKSGLIVVLGVAAGLMLLFKTNEGVAACVLFYVLLLDPVKELNLLWRTTWRYAFLPPIALVLGFIVVERNVTALWGYLKISLQIVLGYSEAMAMPGTSYQLYLAIFSFIVLGFVIPLLADNRAALAKGFACALVTSFFAFKSGTVRQDDGHAGMLHAKFAVASLFLLVCVKTVRDRRMIVTYAVSSFCFQTLMYREIFPRHWESVVRRATLMETAANLSENLHISATWARDSAASRDQMAQLHLDAPVLDAVRGGTVDDVPIELDYVDANGLRWRPRPIIQSYSAYTPALDELNARHLVSAESADYILMQWTDIDGRQPLLDDAASWRALFDRYDVKLQHSDSLVLQRRRAGRYLAPRFLESSQATWRRNIAIPSLDARQYPMLRAEISKNIYGMLRGVFFRNSATYLNAIYNSGARKTFRVTRANLGDGSLLAYLPQSLDEVLPYFGQRSERRPDAVRSISFESPDEFEFSSVIRISWYAVGFAPSESLPEQLTKEIEVHPVPPNGALSRKLGRQANGSAIDNVNGTALSANGFQIAANGPITISGWAVDSSDRKPAAAVFIEVDGNLFPTSYGLDRSDVAAYFNESEYKRVGYTGTVQAAPGVHTLSLRVLNNAATGYYTCPLLSLTVNRIPQ